MAETAEEDGSCAMGEFPKEKGSDTMWKLLNEVTLAGGLGFMFIVDGKSPRRGKYNQILAYKISTDYTTWSTR
jgi:hypothetical protein